jgi:hypothetical protein
VPGIMGSNLKVKGLSPLRKADDIAWRPDVAGLKNAALSAASRQQLLDPNNTLVDKRVTVNGVSSVVLPLGMSFKAAESRGWGSVYWKSYGDVLRHLDLLLNSPFFYDPTLAKVLIMRTQIAVSGIDHQGAYATRHETVMSFISYSVCKIAKSEA